MACEHRGVIQQVLGDIVKSRCPQCGWMSFQRRGDSEFNKRQVAAKRATYNARRKKGRPPPDIALNPKKGHASGACSRGC